MWSLRQNNFRHAALAALLFCVGVTATPSSGEEVIRVYGSEGPGFAVREAAEAFHAMYGVQVVIVTGPVETWREAAKGDADVVFASAGYIMSDMLSSGDVQINPTTVTPLYVCPPAVLVRPGNPKGIRDFPDLLRSGVRIMVVTGSGQSGLWEDINGRPDDIQTLRQFRRNVLVAAPTSEIAERTWRERDDIDAWVTWNPWYLPLHQHADLVTVSKENMVYRQCSVALTDQGMKNPAANRFLAFLGSRDGARIFQSWDWQLPDEVGESSGDTVIAVVCRLDNGTCSDGQGQGLLRLRSMLDSYAGATDSPCELRVVAVLDGDAVRWLLNDERYSAATGKRQQNPNREIVEELLRRGVNLEVSGKALSENGCAKQDLIPGVNIVEDANPRIVNLQLQGYASLTF